MCCRNTHNHFHVLEDLSEDESELNGNFSDDNCHATLPICFGDYLAIAMDTRGSNDKRSIRGQRGFVSQKCRKSKINRGTSVVVPEHRSNASLQMGSARHVDDTLSEELDHGWYKICKGSAVRQNLNPFLEAQKALGIEKPVSVLLRPPAGDSVTEAYKGPWRKP
jgi:hypothetical protein